MNRLFLNLLTFAVGIVAYSTPAAAQLSPTVKKATHVRITQGPELERNDSYLAIVRWSSNNPGGAPVHYGVVHYGTNPRKLRQTARSPVRLNPGHDYTVFRVRMNDLKPRTTYYYTVDSTDEKGVSDGVRSRVRQFSTP
jgi:phosphodiesterase/alkaline phosphatase D-like protein